MSELLAHLPITRLVPEGHYGLAGTAGVSARLVHGLSAATMVARRGVADLLCRHATLAGLPLVDGPRVAAAAGIAAVGVGPGRWLVLAEDMSGAALIGQLSACAGGHAVFTDQTDANLIIEVSGARARDCLAKGVSLDLDPRSFAPGAAATTVVAHVGVTFWRMDDQADGAPLYRFAVARSFAPAFLRWLAASAAEFGFAMSGTGRG